MTSTLKRKCAGIQDWTPIDEHHAAGEFTVKLLGWSKERRFVVVRERIRETKAAVGRKLDRRAGLHVPGLGDQPERRRAGVVARLQRAGLCGATDRGIEARSGRRRVLPAPVLCDRVSVPGRLVHLQPVESVSASNDPRRSVSAAGNLAHGGVPVRGGAGSDGPRCGGETLGGVGSQKNSPFFFLLRNSPLHAFPAVIVSHIFLYSSAEVSPISECWDFFRGPLPMYNPSPA